jgi:hypothetical protein
MTSSGGLQGSEDGDEEKGGRRGKQGYPVTSFGLLDPAMPAAPT